MGDKDRDLVLHVEGLDARLMTLLREKKLLLRNKKK
jgi:hypothetical protein